MCSEGNVSEGPRHRWKEQFGALDLDDVAGGGLAQSGFIKELVLQIESEIGVA